MDEKYMRKKFSEASLLAKLVCYALIFLVTLGLWIVHLKTGINLGRYSNSGNQDPMSWPEVWAQLPGALLGFVFVMAIGIVVIEWKNIRRMMKGDESGRE